MHNIPVLSIIVPVYNVEKYLHRCLDSIRSQSFVDFECILVNDASPDNSPAICDEYCSKDNRFRVIHKPVNEGLPKARKTGLCNANANFVMHVDSDDWLEPDALQVLFKHQLANDADIVRARFKSHFHSFFLNSTISFPYDNKSNPLISFYINGFFPLWATLYKMMLFDDYIVPEYSIGEDTITNVQLLSRARPDKIFYIDDIVYNYDCRTSGMTKSKRKAYMSINDDPRINYRLFTWEFLLESEKSSKDVEAAFLFDLILRGIIPYICTKKEISKTEIFFLYNEYWAKFGNKKLLDMWERKIIPIYNKSISLGKIYSFFMRVIVFCRRNSNILSDAGFLAMTRYLKQAILSRILKTKNGRKEMIAIL